MPRKPKRPCSAPGCPLLTEGRYCGKHQQEADKEYRKQRGSSTQQGYGYRWRKARAAYLAKHPLCTSCLVSGQITLATVVDHKNPHKGDEALFWDEDNWQALCKSCHDTKTAKQDGRWNRA